MDYHQTDLARLNWYGVKPTLKRMLTWPVVNVPLGAVARFFPASTRSRIPVRQPGADYRLLDGSTVRMWDPGQCCISAELHWGAGRRMEAADQHAIACAEQLCREANLFLDIGAYSGLFTLVAAKANPNLVAHAYEIVPENYVLLVKNVVLNALHGRAQPHLLGLADKPGQMVMPISTGLAQLPSSLSLSSEFENGAVIPLSTIDSEFADFNGVAVFKIDVEGFEPQVLQGGSQFLARVRPHMVCEVLESQDTSGALHALLDPLGYHCYQFTAAGLVRRDRIKPSPEGRDWLLTPLDPAELRVKLVETPVA